MRHASQPTLTIRSAPKSNDANAVFAHNLNYKSPLPISMFCISTHVFQQIHQVVTIINYYNYHSLEHTVMVHFQ